MRTRIGFAPREKSSTGASPEKAARRFQAEGEENNVAWLTAQRAATALVAGSVTTQSPRLISMRRRHGQVCELACLSGNKTSGARQNGCHYWASPTIRAMKS
jgi:hypothetical protein